MFYYTQRDTGGFYSVSVVGPSHRTRFNILWILRHQGRSRRLRIAGKLAIFTAFYISNMLSRFIVFQC